MTEDTAPAAAADRPSAVAQLAQALGETKEVPLGQIERIVDRCGVERAQAWLAETERIEAEGGMLLSDGSRRRTKGGVFFYLVRGAVSIDDRRFIFPRPTEQERREARKRMGPVVQVQAPPKPPTTTWNERGPFVQEARQQPGKATSVKITVIGRPVKAVERQGFALLVLQHEGKLAAMPKGLPLPPEPLPTQYIVYVGGKQWNKVKASLANPQDVLIVEGVPVLDPKYAAITVFAVNTTTKLLQQSKRAEGE